MLSTQRLSCALTHKRVYDRNLTDPYFTEEQWQSVLDALLDDATDIVGEVVAIVENVSTIREKGKNWLERKGNIPLCTCKAHKCQDPDFYTDVLGALVTIQPPLNDDTGSLFANVLLTHILKAANLRRLTIHGSKGGTVGSVRYILRLPSGTEYVYRGWPDFLVCQHFSLEERTQLSAEETVRGVGEIQSPRGTSTEVKNRAFAQAGIYTLGYFCNTMVMQKLTTVVLYKDMTAHVALATIDRSKGEAELVGDVTYKVVYSFNPFNLQKQEDLALFASVFIATLKTTLY